MSNSGCENDSSSPVTILTKQLAHASFDSTPCIGNVKSIFDDDKSTPLVSKNTIQRRKRTGNRRSSKSKSQNKVDTLRNLPSYFDESANLEPPTLDAVRCFVYSETASLSSESSGFAEEYRNRFIYIGDHDSKSSCSNSTCVERSLNDEGFSESAPTIVGEDSSFSTKFYNSPELSAHPILSMNKNSHLYRTSSNDSDSSFIRRRPSAPVLSNLVRQNSMTAEMAGGYFQRRNQLGLDSLSDMPFCNESQTSENSPVRGKVSASELDDTIAEEHKVTPKRCKPCFTSSGDTPLLPGGTIDSPNSKSVSKSRILGCINSPAINLPCKKPQTGMSSTLKLSDVTNTLTRCYSVASTLDEKKVANSISSRDMYFLAGDSKSRSVLPTLETTGQGRQFEISCVSSETVCDLIKGRYEQLVSDYTIVDCRYPYEFNGGHICDAINIFTHDQLLNMFFRRSQHSSNSRRHIRFTETEKKSVVIFHCEFSSKRAPILAKFLRSVDRSSNFHQYPNLYFPEIYVMKGGYSDFYKRCPEMCTPHNYVKMFDLRYRNDFKSSEKIYRQSKVACLQRVRQEQDELSPLPLPPSLRGIEHSSEFGSQSTTSSPTLR